MIEVGRACAGHGLSGEGDDGRDSERRARVPARSHPRTYLQQQGGEPAVDDAFIVERPERVKVVGRQLGGRCSLVDERVDGRRCALVLEEALRSTVQAQPEAPGTGTGFEGGQTSCLE